MLAADTPGAAIALAEQHAGTIDLLITDAIMPEMNGRDGARRVLLLHPHVKRLFTSGYTADVIAHRGVVEQGLEFLHKPFSHQVLLTRVRQVLDRA